MFPLDEFSTCWRTKAVVFDIKRLAALPPRTWSHHKTGHSTRPVTAQDRPQHKTGRSTSPVATTPTLTPPALHVKRAEDIVVKRFSHLCLVMLQNSPSVFSSAG